MTARAPDKDAVGRAGAAALVLIVAGAAALRFSTLGVQSFSDDEQFTVWLCRMPFGQMLGTLPESEGSPPLYYLFSWASAQVLGTSEVAMRVLPALLGTLTIPLVYLAGAMAGARRVGLAGAAFAAVNPFLLWYSQEARAYALLIFLTTLGLVFLVAFRRSGSGLALASWTLATVAAMLTHYFAAFVVVPQAVWLVLVGRGDHTRRIVAASLPAGVGAALLPLAIHQRNVVGDPGGVQGRGLDIRLPAVPKNFLVGYSIPLETLAIVAASALAAFALALAWRHSRGSERWLGAHAGALAVLTVVLAVALALAGSDYVNSRNLIVALVPVCLLLGCGFAQGRMGLIALAAMSALTVFIAIGVATDRRYQRRDWRGASQALGPTRTDRALVFSPPFSNVGPFEVYYGDVGRIPARIREIAVVALADYGGFGPSPGRPPQGPPQPAPAGFRVTRDDLTPTYRIVVYSRPSPRRVRVSEINDVAFPRTGRVLLGQTANPAAQRR